jgi:hypothetical protein
MANDPVWPVVRRQTLKLVEYKIYVLLKTQQRHIIIIIIKMPRHCDLIVERI